MTSGLIPLFQQWTPTTLVGLSAYASYRKFLMARKIKNLSVKTREYVDGQGNKKANWQNIGVVMENDQGKQFMLIDRWVNLAGLPDFSGKPNPSAVMVTMFDVDDYKPTQKAPSTSDNEMAF